MPRWSMFFPMDGYDSGAYAVVDMREADSAAEIAWFEREFAPELDLARQAAALHGFEYGVRWGMVCYVY